MRDPGVKFPPLLLFVLGFGLGILLYRFWPLGLVPGAPNRLSVGLGWGLFLLGTGLLLWALWTFWKARTGIYPTSPASHIVARGPYRFSRNPMYAALTAMYTGVALWADMLWPVVVLPIVLWLLWRLVIRREERYLAHAFGDSYASYRGRVRRWL